MGVRTVLQTSTLKSLSLALQARTNDPTVTDDVVRLLSDRPRVQPTTSEG